MTTGIDHSEADILQRVYRCCGLTASNDRLVDRASSVNHLLNRGFLGWHDVAPWSVVTITASGLKAMRARDIEWGHEPVLPQRDAEYLEDLGATVAGYYFRDGVIYA